MEPAALRACIWQLVTATTMPKAMSKAMGAAGALSTLAAEAGSVFGVTAGRRWQRQGFAERWGDTMKRGSYAVDVRDGMVVGDVVVSGQVEKGTCAEGEW